MKAHGDNRFLFLSGTAAFSVTSSAATGAVGNASVTGAAAFAVTGLGITGSVGTGTSAPILSLGFSVTGVSATGAVGEEVLYRPIVPSQTPNWSGVSVSQTPNWTDIAA